MLTPVAMSCPPGFCEYLVSESYLKDDGLLLT